MQLKRQVQMTPLAQLEISRPSLLFGIVYTLLWVVLVLVER